MSPSDDDLDCLFKAWTAPACPGSLERRIRRSYGDRRRFREIDEPLNASPVRGCARLVPFAGKFAGVVAAAVVLLAVITRAFPQSLYFIASPDAITLESEILDYGDDGSYTVSEYRTSSWKTAQVEGGIVEGGETVLSRSFPADPLRTATDDLLDPVLAVSRSIIQRVFSPLFYRPGRAKFLSELAVSMRERIRNGCVPTNMWARPMTVIGRETVLNYTTTVSQLTLENGSRLTEWFAPGLDCVSLRSTTEKALGVGDFQRTSERRVLKVTNSGRTAAGEANR
jgi:hypothetical protein